MWKKAKIPDNWCGDYNEPGLKSKKNVPIKIPFKS